MLHLVFEHLRKARIPALGHAADARGTLALFVVEIDVEVIGLEHLEFEVLVLDFVSAEVLRLGRPAASTREQGEWEEVAAGTGEISAAWRAPGK